MECKVRRKHNYRKMKIRNEIQNFQIDQGWKIHGFISGSLNDNQHIYIYKRLRPRKKIRNRKKKEQQKL